MCSSNRDPEITFKLIYRQCPRPTVEAFLAKSDVKEQMWDTWMRWLDEAYRQSEEEIVACG